jgi:type VI secretion system secreted protein Hcp
MPIYLKVGGNKLACEEVHFDTTSPRDPSSGLATGRRQYGQLKILYTLDSRAPAFQALATNQVLPVVQLQFTKTDQAGKEQVYHVVHLGNTKVVGVQPHVLSKHGTFRGLLLEYLEYDLVYRQITWTHGKGGKAFNDDWS